GAPGLPLDITALLAYPGAVAVSDVSYYRITGVRLNVVYTIVIFRGDGLRTVSAAVRRRFLHWRAEMPQGKIKK
ncbi:MAG: hypothetical protein HRT70_07635, partial [Flavobacteriaceae bacterium]|nr:hypothetical protein [Flavobacteriaceae bacterium]